MTDPIAIAARAAARRLETGGQEGLRAEVEAALAARQLRSAPSRYSDLVSLASLVIAIANLAWNVYSDQRERTSQPTVEDVAREVRNSRGEIGPEAPHELVEVVVVEVIRVAEDSDSP